MRRIFQEEYGGYDEDFYSEKYLEESIEGDEITNQEEGFMMGYLSI